MKYLLLALLLSACGGSSYKEGTQISETTEAADDLYIVAGQSNALRCDWSYFEGVSGMSTVNIAISGRSIDVLIDSYVPESVIETNPTGIIFIHGETDGQLGTDVDYYVKRVEEYRLMISADTGRDLPIYISSVGYFEGVLDADMDLIRERVEKEALFNDKWFIAYSDTKFFRGWGAMSDFVHYNNYGCGLMLEGIAAYI